MMNRNAVKLAYILITALITITILNIYTGGIRTVDILKIKRQQLENDYQIVEKPLHINLIENANWRNFTNDQINNLSILGKHLFLNEDFPAPNTSKSYKILVWKYGKYIHARHVMQYGSTRLDPFQKCSVKNCHITYEDDDYDTADIVIIHLHRMQGLKDLPKKQRPENQIWAFLTDESPYHTSMSGAKLPIYDGYFNWSMGYRTDCDIPVPYGRTLIKSENDIIEDFDINNWILSKKYDVYITIMGSNCGGVNHRWDYVKELQKYINVDIYGGCGPLKCPGHFRKDCPEVGKYMFYLSFENANCDEYITEKVWWNAYHKNSIPIVMGSSKKTYSYLLPPNSYINTEEFARPQDLANYINYVVTHPEELVKYFEWKKTYKIVNEHGYFATDSFHYCRVCEALNYNDKKKKVYNDLKSFWSVERNCHPPWN